MKGEQGQPKIKKQSQSNSDVSSESERKDRGNNTPKRRKNKKSKQKKLTIHKTERRLVDKSQLREDAVFKGYHSTLIQDIVIMPHNVLFEPEVYYSPSRNKSIIAPLPDGYEGDFAPGLKALILDMHHTEEMTESAIHHFLTTHRVEISIASISRILTDKHDAFHQEKKDIVAAGLQSTSYQQMDDTGS